MFTKRTKQANYALNPESLESGAVISQNEIASQPALQVLHGRKTTVVRGADTLEASVAAQFERADISRSPLPALHIMRGVAKPETETREEPVTAVQSQETRSDVRSKPKDRPEADNTVVYMDERRTRKLMQDDANRQVAEAFETAGSVEAELVSAQQPAADQLIPDLKITEATPMVVDARLSVQQAFAEAERLRAATRKDELDAELALLANQRSQERAAA